jgi:UTP--glucose-1-phosphate uridylyltransferase
MKVKKAVITAAGPAQRELPIQSLIDRDGIKKTVLELLIEESLQAGIEEIGVVVFPGDEKNYANAIGKYASQVEFIRQNEPLGYGHSLLTAAAFVSSEPFLHLVGDHLYVNRSSKRCAKHLVEVAEKEECSVSTVQPTRESFITNFGVIGGGRVPGALDLYKIDRVIEKPTPTQAEQKLLVPGLRAGHYLCFFGMHVLTPTVFSLLKNELNNSEGKAIGLSNALNELAAKEKYLALEKNELRFDMGARYGLFKAQLALAMSGKDRDRLMGELLEFFTMKELINKEN